MNTTVNDLISLIDETLNMYIVDRQTGEIITIETNRYRKDFIYGFKP